MSEIDGQPISSELEIINYLRSPKTIRSQSEKIYQLSLDGYTHFKVNLDKLSSTANFVLATIKTNYPDLKIPVHSRWNHFNVGGLDRVKVCHDKVSTFSDKNQAISLLDLVIVSVLLDAGAGSDWKYFDECSQQTYSRSEGLAVASFNMFMAGCFSDDIVNPYQVNAKKLMSLTTTELASGLQVSKDNPLLGIKGRLKLLHSLGDVCAKNAKVFDVNGRPGALLNTLPDTLVANDILQAVLKYFSAIWPGRLQVFGVDLGDVWQHPMLGGRGDPASLVPFHKLSQWLTYSMIWPLEVAGKTVTGVDGLTGLPEYRNGGLLIDSGLISLRLPKQAKVEHKVDSSLVVEWRALTVVLLDKIADVIRQELGFSKEEFPLAKVLEGGTWAAGRVLANKLRAGLPPLKIKSDGTVF